MTNELTPEEIKLAYQLLCDVMSDSPIAHRQLEAAPTNIRAAIGIALAQISAAGRKSKPHKNLFE